MKTVITTIAILIAFNGTAQTHDPNEDSMAIATKYNNKQPTKDAKPYQGMYTGYYEYKYNYKETAGGDFSGILAGLFVKQISSTKIIVALNYNKGGPEYNNGSVFETLPIVKNKAVYKNAGNISCIILFKLLPGIIEVQQIGSDIDCGMGHGVIINGTFKRLNKKIPTNEQLYPFTDTRPVENTTPEK
jgi:hypothetical protein